MTSDPFTRLRGANPVRHDPLDPRLQATRPKPARHRPLALVAIALVAAAILASTAYAISAWVGGGEAITTDVAEQEYLDAQPQLALPPGAAWPKLHWPAGLTGLGAGGGHAVMVAENAWSATGSMRSEPATRPPRHALRRS